MRPSYQRTDVGLLPQDWSVSTVGREFEVKVGKMLDAEKNVGVPKPYLGNKAVQWNRIDISVLPTFRMRRAELDRFRLRNGDILVCEGGEVGRAAIWNAPIQECYYQKALHRLRPRRGYNTQLLIAVLQRWSQEGVLSEYVTQTSIAHLPREKLLAVPLPLPSPNEQAAIAAALSDADAFIESLEQLIAKKRVVRQGAMFELLTGKLRLPGFTGEWNERLIGSVAHVLKGKGLSKTKITPSGARPCILYGELFTTYGRVIRDVLSRTDSGDGLPSVSGDVLMPGSTTTTGADLATASALMVNDVALGGDVLVIRAIGREYEPAFLAYYLTHACERAITELAQGMTIYHLHGRNLAQIVLHLPPREEQAAIADLLCDIDAEIAALEAKLAKARQVKQGMMQELLTGRIRLI